MATAAARKPVASARPSVMPSKATARQGKGRKANPSVFKRLVQTFDVDGRDLQSVTEWWSGKPKGIESREDPENPGIYLTTRLYCPYGKVFFDPNPSLNPPAKATA